MLAKAAEQSTSMATGKTPSRASQLPQSIADTPQSLGNLQTSRSWHATNPQPCRKPVEAGLLAKAAEQSTSMATGKTPSRASPLPQSIADTPQSLGNLQTSRSWHATNPQPCRKPVGAGLLAKAAEQSTSMATGKTLSRASPLPQSIADTPQSLGNLQNQPVLARHQSTAMPKTCGSGLARESGRAVIRPLPRTWRRFIR